MFTLLASDVFQEAFLGGTIAAAMAGVVGYFLVLRAQAFAAEAFMDICFAGATGASLLGQSPLIGMIGFSLLSVLGLGALGERARGRSVEIGMVLSFALGIGFSSAWRGAPPNPILTRNRRHWPGNPRRPDRVARRPRE